MSYIQTFKVQFIQDSSFFRVLFRQDYTGFQFIQGSVQTGLYRIPVFSGFCLDRIIQDSSLFRVLFRQVYTGFQFIQGSVQTGLYRIPVYSGFCLERFIQDSSFFRVLFRQVYTGFLFIQDSSLFRVLFRQVYTGFQFIQGSVQTGLYGVLFRQVYTGFQFFQGSVLDRFIQDSSLFRTLFRHLSSSVIVDNLIYKNVIRIPFGTISGFVNCEFILLLILRDKYIVLTMDHIRHKQAYQTKNLKK